MLPRQSIEELGNKVMAGGCLKITQNRTEKYCLLLVVSILYGVTVTLNWPGHYSVDSIVQLAEGMTGYYFSIHPALMSQVLGSVSALFGHGVFMAISSSLFFLAIAIILTNGSGNRLHFWIAGIAAVCISLNPVTLIYNGTVWKDVLCANLLLLSFAVLSRASPRNWVYLLAALCLSAIASLVRQQGFLVAVIVWAYAVWQMTAPVGWTLKRSAKQLLLIVFLWVSMLLSLNWFVTMHQKEIHTDPAGGLVTAARFDIAGMIVNAHLPEKALADFVEIPALTVAAARSAYTPERVDTLGPFFATLPALSNSQTFALWWQLAKAEPVSLWEHKRMAAAALFGARPNGQCLPAHLGIAGATLDILKKLDFPYDFPPGFLPPTPTYMPQLWSYLSNSFIFFTGWIWLAVLCVVFILGCRNKNSLAISISVGGLVYSGSFAVVGIACDFRYQYFGVVGGMLGLLSLLCNYVPRKTVGID